MVKDYSNAKIYKVVSPHTQHIYIGSTVSKLSARLSCHVINRKRGLYCSVNEILKHGDYSIILIEKVKCDDVDELRARERHHIEQNKNCVNMKLPNRTLTEYKATEQYKHYCKTYADIYKQGERRRDQPRHERVTVHGLKINQDDKEQHGTPHIYTVKT